MTDDLIEISKRAVACRGWQWMPGMRTINGRRLAVVFGLSRTASVLCDLRDDANSDTEELQGELPDLADPATVGCLLALVRKAWGDPTLCVVLDTSDGRWCVGCWEDNGIAMRGRGGATETEALVNALEGAP